MGFHPVFNFLNIGYIAQALLMVMCVFFVCSRVKYVFGKASSKRFSKSGTARRSLDSFDGLLDEMSVARGGTGNVCLMASLKSKESLSHEHVRDALVLLAKRQPMLRATRTTTENGDKYFELKEINEVIAMLNITSSDVNSSDWKDVWFEYTAEQLGNGLLWRLVILEEEFIPDTEDYVTGLMFSFHHAIIDGVSTVRLCKQFLHYMNELANGATTDQKIPSLNMLPYFHDMIVQKRAWHPVLNFMLTYCGLRPILRFFMKKMISYQFQTMKCNPYFAQYPPRLDVSSFVGPMRLNTKVFTKNETKNILKACKANHCTVTGALTTAANLAFCELIQDGLKENEAPKIQWEFAINAKRVCDPKPNEEYLDYFVYMCDELFMDYKSSTDVDFWKLAQETTKEIQDNVKAERYVVKEALLFKLLKPKEGLELVDRETLVRISSCNLISSFGSFDFGADDQQQPYKLNECFVNVVSHGFPVTFSHHNHTINGKMGWQISYDASRVKFHHAEKFAKLCFDRFIEIAGGRA